MNELEFRFKIKQPHLLDQLNQSPVRLRTVAYAFIAICNEMDITPVITRVWDKVNDKESGVHQNKRAVDFRNEYGNKMLFSHADAQDICHQLNEAFPRLDDKLVAIHHSFNGGPYHFHLQIPYSWI